MCNMNGLINYKKFIIYLSAHDFGGVSLISPTRGDGMSGSGINGINSLFGSLISLV
jgi:hypothetical protein